MYLIKTIITGLTLVEPNRSSSAPNVTVSASSLATIDGCGGRQCITAGTQVSSPSPDRSSIFLWNSSDDSSKSPVSFECSMNRLYGSGSAPTSIICKFVDFGFQKKVEEDGEL